MWISPPLWAPPVANFPPYHSMVASGEIQISSPGFGPIMCMFDWFWDQDNECCFHKPVISYCGSQSYSYCPQRVYGLKHSQERTKEHHVNSHYSLQMCVSVHMDCISGGWEYGRTSWVSSICLWAKAACHFFLASLNPVWNLINWKQLHRMVWT